MLVSVFKNKVKRQCVWFTSNQTSEMMRLLRCSGTAHPIHLSAGNTGPPPISDWTDSSYCLLLKAIFPLVLGLLKTRPCCSGASITHAAALHTDTWAACFPRCPEGKYGFVCPAQQVSHINPWCCEINAGGCDPTEALASQAGQSHIDLRFIRSMVSAAAWGGSTRECQCAISRSRHVLQAEKLLGVIVRKHWGRTRF